MSGVSKVELSILALAQSRRFRQIRTGDVQRLLGVTTEQERKALSRMARRGLAARVRRGLYLLPESLPIGGKWGPGEALALTALMLDRDARFQICGPNAFQRYGWDDQIPNRVYAYNNRISGDRTVGKVELTLIRVADERLGETESVTTPEGIDLVYSSRARSLIDAVYDWSRFNSLPQAFGWIGSDLSAGKVTTADLADIALTFGNQGAIRRIGYLLELLSEQTKALARLIPSRLVLRLERVLSSSSSTIPWIPTMPKRGRINKRWGVVVNGTIPSTT